MATRRETRAEKKAATRERLLAAAERMAKRDGFARLSLDAVAEAAGLTKGAIYSNFASKEEFLLAAAERFTAEVTIDLPDHIRDLDAFMRHVAEGVSDMSRRRPKQVILGVEFMALALRDAKLRQALKRELDEDDPQAAGNEQLAAWADAHDVEFPLPVETFVELVDALAIGILLRRMVYGPERLPDEVVEWLFRQLVRPAE